MTNVCTPLAKIAPQNMGHGSKVVYRVKFEKFSVTELFAGMT